MNSIDAEYTSWAAVLSFTPTPQQAYHAARSASAQEIAKLEQFISFSRENHEREIARLTQKYDEALGVVDIEIRRAEAAERALATLRDEMLKEVISVASVHSGSHAMLDAIVALRGRQPL